MIDEAGYRPNVGIIVINQEQQVLWAKRIQNDNAWQFPQGGVDKNETPLEAMYRELYEEIGLRKSDVGLLAETKEWLHYELPDRYIRHNTNPLCVGQKQKWFLLELRSTEMNIRLDTSNSPEFNAWCWVDFWYPIQHVIPFKEKVYEDALKEFALILNIPAPL
jgi:putative (di)nucleoside polyphosphate hydrolase